jgi:NAD(P)-dependent dehydrogenase (short-subunit alcohol dehydrogenase family)
MPLSGTAEQEAAMARIFVTGSSTGLLLAGQRLANEGHEVVIHARNATRASDARQALLGAAGVVTGDLETVAGAKSVAMQANALGPFDAVIHNAATLGGANRRENEDGVPAVFAVNVFAPYILTALISLPKRLVYLSSSMHLGASANLDDLLWRTRSWNGSAAYSESKLYVLMLAFALPRRYPGVVANGVDPGWVPTRMGGSGAPDDLTEGARTQAVLATAGPEDPLGSAIQQYFYHLSPRAPHPQSRDARLQDRLLDACARATGVPMP